MVWSTPRLTLCSKKWRTRRCPAGGTARQCPDPRRSPVASNLRPPVRPPRGSGQHPDSRHPRPLDCRRSGVGVHAVNAAARNLEAHSAGAAMVGDNLGAALGAARCDAAYARVLFVFLGLPGAVLAGLLTAAVVAAGADRRRRDQALVRTRGAPRRQLMRLAAAEAGVVGVVGAARAGAAAVIGRAMFGSVGFGATAAARPGRRRRRWSAWGSPRRPCWLRPSATLRFDRRRRARWRDRVEPLAEVGPLRHRRHLAGDVVGAVLAGRPQRLSDRPGPGRGADDLGVLLGVRRPGPAVARYGAAGVATGRPAVGPRPGGRCRRVAPGRR